MHSMRNNSNLKSEIILWMKYTFRSTIIIIYERSVKLFVITVVLRTT